jgi:hypothetical protein
VTDAFEKQLGGTGQRGKRGLDVGASAWRREKEERGGPGRGSRQLRAAGNGPQLSGTGGAVATRTEEGGGRGRCERRGERN